MASATVAKFRDIAAGMDGKTLAGVLAGMRDTPATVATHPAWEAQRPVMLAVLRRELEARDADLFARRAEAEEREAARVCGMGHALAGLR